MRFLAQTWPCLALALVLLLPPWTDLLAQATDFDAAAKSLFDGKSLAGWEGDPAHWRVEARTIVGEIPPGQSLNKNTWLIWKGGELSDFDLRLQFRLSGLPAANSGIQFRCQAENVDHVSGYQADLDMGATWLGRIYDEHGRALIVERGARVAIAESGERQIETFAPANQFAVLFRDNDWNDYRILAIGSHVAVYINGTLFSELQDEQTGERDLTGQLAFQLHSGPETRGEFRNILLEQLKLGDPRLPEFHVKPQPVPDESNAGIMPLTDDGRLMNLGFESGDLTDWTASGDAFSKQPVDNDGIAQRWPGQVSNKNGEFFIGGFEIVQDGGMGMLMSAPFPVTHPYGSFLLSGGEATSTRVDLIQVDEKGVEQSVVYTAVGQNSEQMRRIAVDLTKLKDKRIAIRVVDENPGAWGHLNFDDFRFHDEPPANVEVSSDWRSTVNPVLQHLVANPIVAPEKSGDGDPPEVRGTETLKQMFVPAGFSVDVVAAERTCTSRWRLPLMRRDDTGSLRATVIRRSVSKVRGWTGF